MQYEMINVNSAREKSLSMTFVFPFTAKIPGGHSQKSLAGVCGPLTKTPYPIYDQNLRISLPYFWPDKKFDIPFMSRPLNGGKRVKVTKTAENP